MANKQKRPQLPFRLNIVFLIVFLLFTVLIVQLGIVQIRDGQAYQEEIDKKIKDVTHLPVPRGRILDRNHHMIVDNLPLYSITYTPPKNVQAKEKLEVAEELADYISMRDKKYFDKITESDKKDYWYLKNEKEALSRLSDEEEKNLKPADQYQTILERITEEEISSFTDDELEIIAIKREMDKAYALTPQVIKSEGVTIEEYSQVAEHLDELNGINAMVDWERVQAEENILSGILGSITSQEQGIPQEREDYFLTRGYNRNDRVGKSGLEQQYEELLRGRKEQVQYTTTKTNQVIDQEVLVEGQPGKDLILTVDLEYQKKIDELVRQEMKKEIGSNPHMEDALVVVLNPKTGEVLALTGQHYNRKEGKFENAAHKTLYDAHRPGSTIKGATILAGYQSGVITPGEQFYDAPIKILGTPQKKSWKNMNWVNDYTALQESSNVYMFYTALRIGGYYGNPNGRPVSVDAEGFQEIRNYFHQFGLGTNTGIDFPYESTGYVGESYQGMQGLAGFLMDYSIGQYDTYTTLQMAQYVSTIANDGYRVRPHLLKEAREPSADGENLGPVYMANNTEVLNRIQMTDSEIQRVQEGFRRAYTNGTAASVFSNKPYKPAGKTGTAENEIFKDGKKIANTSNVALVGYAPYDDPEVAFAVIIPHMTNGNQLNLRIGAGVLDTYFDLKKEQDSGEREESENED